jgi:hypothetical protein
MCAGLLCWYSRHDRLQVRSGLSCCWERRLERKLPFSETLSPQFLFWFLTGASLFLIYISLFIFKFEKVKLSVKGHFSVNPGYYCSVWLGISGSRLLQFYSKTFFSPWRTADKFCSGLGHFGVQLFLIRGNKAFNNHRVFLNRSYVNFKSDDDRLNMLAILTSTFLVTMSLEKKYT